MVIKLPFPLPNFCPYRESRRTHISCNKGVIPIVLCVTQYWISLLTSRTCVSVSRGWMDIGLDSNSACLPNNKKGRDVTKIHMHQTLRQRYHSRFLSLSLSLSFHRWPSLDTSSVSMYVCMYACMYVWLYVCMYGCIYVCMKSVFSCAVTYGYFSYISVCRPLPPVCVSQKSVI